MDAADNLIDTKFSCSVCGEVLSVSPSILSDKEELRCAIGCWMVEHIDKHGGDPEKVSFSAPFDGIMLKASQ